MKVSTEFTPDRIAILTVEVEPDQVQGALQRVAQTVSRKRPIPGFRPGKAPYHLVERVIGKELLQEQALEELSQALYPQLLEENNIRPTEKGRVEIVQKDPPIFKYTIPVKPEVKLGDYRSIHLTSDAVEISAEEVNQALAQFQLGHATMVPVARAAQIGDMVTLDIRGGVPGRDAIDEKNVRVAIGAPQRTALAFEHQLLGMTAGETKEIVHTYPADYADEGFRGQTATYTVTVHDIKETQVPELNDEFVQAVSQLQTLEQLKGNVRAFLHRQKESDAEVRFVNQVLDAVVAQSEIAFAPVMLQDEIEQQLNRVKEEAKGLGLTWEKFLELSGQTAEQMREQVRPSAEQQLKRLLVIGELMEAEKIEVSRAEVDAEIARQVASAIAAGGNANTARRAHHTREARRNLEINLRMGKTMARIVMLARGEPTSAKILIPEMLKGHATSSMPTGLITDPRQVRAEDWPRGLEGQR